MPTAPEGDLGGTSSPTPCTHPDTHSSTAQRGTTLIHGRSQTHRSQTPQPHTHTHVSKHIGKWSHTRVHTLSSVL